MRYAIISVTKEGRNLATKISACLGEDPTVIRTDLYHKDVKKTLENIFPYYDCIIGVMAASIMVRSVCPLMNSKTKDPAVLVIGETGKHVISLLSGHLGGANQLSVKISNLIGAKPVITTATDLKGKLGIDLIARDYWLEIEDPQFIKNINEAILHDGAVELYLPERFYFLANHPKVKRSYNVHKWDNSFVMASIPEIDIKLIPRKLIAGIGSRKGVSTGKVVHAVQSALQFLQLPLERLDRLATLEIKKDERGIKEASSKLNLEMEIVPLDDVKNFKHPDIRTTPRVMREFGVVGVSEPSSLIVAGAGSRLVLRKTAFNGVTVALAVSGI